MVYGEDDIYVKYTEYFMSLKNIKKRKQQNIEKSPRRNFSEIKIESADRYIYI